MKLYFNEVRNIQKDRFGVPFYSISQLMEHPANLIPSIIECAFWSGEVIAVDGQGYEKASAHIG